jgi:hypothetical protein
MINIGGGDDRIGLAKLMKIKLQTSWPTSGAMINLCFRIIKEATLICNNIIQLIFYVFNYFTRN